MRKEKLRFLIGDNPFHGISHLSQDRARTRSKEIALSDTEHAAKLVEYCLANGASGFTFSVSETTLSIVKALDQSKTLDLYPIVPYSYEYVRIATKTGGFSGLAKKVIRQIMLSGNWRAITPAIAGSITTNPSKLLQTYLIYELSRIKHVTGKNSSLKSVILHEVVTDMALALNLDWLFLSYIDLMTKNKIRPGIHTRNLPFLVNKFDEWDIDMRKITLLTPFNKIGFAMNPSRNDCETSLQSLSNTQVIAMGILASGYLEPFDAISYVAGVPNITDIAVGVSSEKQALETFKLLREQNE